MDGNNVTNNNIVTNYKEARARSREALRRGLLDAAGRLLTSEGPGALSVRRVAREVNCSTKVIYTMFGGKEGLVEELYLEGFERLGGALEAVPHGENPLAYLGALGRAYRESALANPTHYAVMFGRPIPEFTPSPSSLRRARSTFEVLEEAVSWCMEAGIFERGDPEEVANVLWAAVHGVVDLELAGHLPEGEGERVFARTLRAVGAGLLNEREGGKP
jgi:AcrR family transcriptional regulator